MTGLCASGWWCARRWRKEWSGPRRVVLTGGGTGGHVNPALAIAEAIKKREPETRFLYVGVAGKAEAVIVKRAGLPLRFVSSRGFPGFRPSLALVHFGVAITWGTLQSLGILMRFRPHWIIATGGYVSAPMVMAGFVLKALGIGPVKIFLHEQNSVPGQMNLLLGRYADRVLLTFPQTLADFPKNGSVVGYPVRHSILEIPREEARQKLSFSLPERRRVVFVFGGSQGARTINRAVVEALSALAPHRDRIFVIHSMGLAASEDYHAVKDTEALLKARYGEDTVASFSDFYYRQDYFHRIAEIYAVSDLVVCRSGAGSLNELARLGKPSLLIPKANLPGDHQVMNARAMKRAGAAEVLFEDTVFEKGELRDRLDGEVLAAKILELLADEAKLKEMSERCRRFFRKQAAARIVSELYGDRSFDNGWNCQALESFSPLLSHQQLLRRLQEAYNADPLGYDPEQIQGISEDLAYYRYRAAALLVNPSWALRNLGVKLIGLTRYQEKTATLVHMLLDRTPASRLERWFGGDFRQVGFIRRNAVHALMVMNRMDPLVEEAIMAAMEDPYYEVRAQACRAVSHFGKYLAGKESWLKAVLEKLEDRCFEVKVEAARALGEVGTDGRAMEALLNLGEAFHWQVRNAALMGVRRLLERQVIWPCEELSEKLGRFILTAPDFRPHFVIRENYNAVMRLCHRFGSARSATAQAKPDVAVGKKT
ncbi:UDP-N-acetylglucosamine--N-acetylmuramyl-(pentapeptide) pyrophosphoryl-undecaprenol N-acetylglucosamine transferase [Desulfosoma caldarium]|uniref:UDP-N-acetylglucosamine--N-acetylmuramyl-(pentapeptide) pyrophosphoryl-undecaprenol N-acetylglucosamine transferase n=2 Tax=Desulfosoma caldarium TaxID=610254 RepID=A0A3N1UM93_9BACT|nr:UDP-N-acetylglucosamine--N-acetylmuramyl-(pentapeptide) pyrophosphoryl-undecaprenol N-acetylglucosamine transferase [Desulfosoma caldarium]